MPDSKRESASSSAISCDDFLYSNLDKFIKRSKNLENGGGLHSMVMSMVEKSLLKMTIEETDGNKSQAAHILGLNRNTLRRKLEVYKIKGKRK